MAEHAVVIAGGGPTGMMLAAELTLAGTDVVIVERRASFKLESSRSRGLQSRTIEVLDQRGVVDRFLAEGKTMQVQAFGGVPMDISDFPTRHNYGMALLQSHFERIMSGWIDELGVPILREREVTGFTQDDSGVDVALSNGTSLRAKFLVGCDGGRSVVRKAAGIDFAGTVEASSHAAWKPGDRLLLSGKMLTGRDAAHQRIQDRLLRGEKLPVDFTDRVIYYVGPVDPVRDEVVGPAGPTTATRMDKFTEMMLGQTGLIAMIGKAERGPAAIAAIRKHKSAYLMGVGGAAYLVSKAIKQARVVGFADLGMEAIYEFEVKDMPVTVAVDSNGTSVHETGPAEWKARIAGIPVAVA